MQNISLSENSVLGADIDLSTVSATNNWTPISYFEGMFDGLGHTISNLHINNSSIENNIGLFGRTENVDKIANINLTNVDITGMYHVGALVGTAIRTHIENVSSSGKVVGGFSVGGLVGYMTESPVTLLKSHSSADVSGTDESIGGLVGQLDNSAIRESYATGDIIGGYNVGGLVGQSLKSTIENSYATGNIDGTSEIGGLVGR